MNMKNLNSTLTFSRRLALTLISALVLSACGSTAKNAQNTPLDNKSNLHSNDKAFNQCVLEAENIGQHAEAVASPAQYLTSANAMSFCLSSHSQSVALENSQTQQQRMQAMAVTALNYIKAGDIASANQVIENFKQRYPRKDLYFSDYTSFLDTAAVLVASNSLTANQLSTLNISRALRDEMERKQYWLSH